MREFIGTDTPHTEVYGIGMDFFCDNDTNDVICVLYLLKESGFKVIPEKNEHLLNNFNYPEITSSIQPNNSQNAINIDHLAYKVTAQAGDLFMFNSGLLHKGVVDGPRLHIHMRLTSSKSQVIIF